MKTQIQPKGYTITAVSWENDADNYKTLSTTVSTEEEARLYDALCKLIVDDYKNSTRDTRFVNQSSDEFSKDAITRIRKVLITHEDKLNSMWGHSLDFSNDDVVTDRFSELSSELVGTSEWYLCRVLESYTITYLPKDIELEVITFE